MITLRHPQAVRVMSQLTTLTPSPPSKRGGVRVEAEGEGV